MGHYYFFVLSSDKVRMKQSPTVGDWRMCVNHFFKNINVVCKVIRAR